MEITAQERELLMAFADTNMSITKTASVLEVDRRTVINRLEAMYKRIKVDPHQFWTLYYLIAYILGEGDLDERKALAEKSAHPREEGL